MSKGFEEHFSKEGNKQTTNKHMKDVQYHLSLGKCKAKPQWGTLPR